jgi:hypothetical protein
MLFKNNNTSELKAQWNVFEINLLSFSLQVLGTVRYTEDYVSVAMFAQQ